MEIEFKVNPLTIDAGVLFNAIMDKMEINDMIPIFVQVGSSKSVFNQHDKRLGNVINARFESEQIYLTIDVYDHWDIYPGIANDFVLTPCVIINNNDDMRSIVLIRFELKLNIKKKEIEVI